MPAVGAAWTLLRNRHFWMTFPVWIETVVCRRLQAEALFVGRVCCDGEGRLNEASAQLEGDIATSKGARVRLDLLRVPALRLFTGQVCAARC